MKHLFYAILLTGATALFSCNGNNTGNAGSSDSALGVVDSSQLNGQPVPEQSTATTPMADQPSQPVSSSSSSSSASSNNDNDDESAASAPEVSYQKFYDELSPYGKWVSYPGQGYVWQPTVEAGFEPYNTNGHWVYTNDGWTWNSGYKWGWAAFHYGRWFKEARYGWLWKPDNRWGPAWVKWGQSGDNYGWAPLTVGISVSASWNPPPQSWTFVPKQYVNRPDVNRYVVNKTQNVTIVKNVKVINNVTNITNNNTKVVVNKNSNNKTVVNNKTVNKNTTVNNNINVKGNNNTVINKGPQVTEVETATKTRVQQVAIANDNKPDAAKIQNNKLVIYRPNINAGSRKVAAPKSVEKAMKDAKQAAKKAEKKANH